jgi:hypothetical protein
MMPDRTLLAASPVSPPAIFHQRVIFPYITPGHLFPMDMAESAYKRKKPVINPISPDLGFKLDPVK